MKGGPGKRSRRHFCTSNRIWSGLSKPIGVQFDELYLRTRYTGWHILRYEEGVGRRDRGAGWRRVVDTNTPDLNLRAGEHVRAKVAAIVAILILFRYTGFMIAPNVDVVRYWD